MRIQYSLTFRDYFSFNMVHQFLIVTNQLVFIGVSTLIAVSEAISFGAVQGVLAWIVVYAATWAFQVVYNLVVLRSKKNRALLTDHIVEVQDDSFSDTTSFYVSVYKWSGIASAVSRPGFVAVYTAAHAAFIIPNRAFADTEQRKAFLAYVRGKIAV